MIRIHFWKGDGGGRTDFCPGVPRFCPSLSRILSWSGRVLSWCVMHRLQGTSRTGLDCSSGVQLKNRCGWLTGFPETLPGSTSSRASQMGTRYVSAKGDQGEFVQVGVEDVQWGDLQVWIAVVQVQSDEPTVAHEGLRMGVIDDNNRHVTPSVSCSLRSARILFGPIYEEHLVK